MMGSDETMTAEWTWYGSTYSIRLMNGRSKKDNTDLLSLILYLSLFHPTTDSNSRPQPHTTYPPKCNPIKPAKKKIENLACSLLSS
jgi:hypothetical protein